MPEDVNWLSDIEQTAWRALLRAHSGLVSVLDAELTAEHDMGLADYEVLLHLNEAEHRALRMTELARNVLLSPSGLTRRLDGLVKRGFVERRPCPSDGRGLLAVLTDSGREVLRTMAPTHVRGVRRHFFDCLSPQQVDQVREIFESLAVAQLGGHCGTAKTQQGEDLPLTPIGSN